VIRQVVAREHDEARLGSVSTEMPRYKCHKEVWALKIEEVIDPTRDGCESDGTLILRFEDYGYAPIRVSRDYARKHSPKAGGYYVVYGDGYKSFSPASAFESGYTRIT
jgi:hypothetical protein